MPWWALRCLSWVFIPQTTKWFFSQWNHQKVTIFPDAVHNQCNILGQTGPIEHKYISSPLWILMAWCWSTRASVASVVNVHTCVSSHLWVNRILTGFLGSRASNLEYLLLSIYENTVFWGLCTRDLSVLEVYGSGLDQGSAIRWLVLPSGLIPGQLITPCPPKLGH